MVEGEHGRRSRERKGKGEERMGKAAEREGSDYEKRVGRGMEKR
jgi:hypothetical protein